LIFFIEKGNFDIHFKQDKESNVTSSSFYLSLVGESEQKYCAMGGEVIKLA
jgi:hypothetical protein